MKCNNCGVDVGLTAAELHQEPAAPVVLSDAFLAAVEAEMHEAITRLRAEWAEQYFAAEPLLGRRPRSDAR